MSHRRFLPLMLLAAVIAAIAGCVSPLDTDTPRLRFEDAPPVPPVKTHRIKPKYFVMTVRDVDRQTDWGVMLSDTLIEIDTTVHPAAVWIRAKVGREYDPAQMIPPFMQQFRFRVDSLVAKGSVFNFTGGPDGVGGADFIIALAKDSLNGGFHTATFLANTEKNLATIKLESAGTQNLISGAMTVTSVTYRGAAIEAKITIRY
jgi:hypothetical protein